MTPRAWLGFLQVLAERADAIALHWFGRGDLAVDAKADQTPVTAADLQIERELRSMARAAHRGLGLIGEEYGTSAASATRLIVDPIDGTANFARGIPIFATLLAIEDHGELVAGVVSAPALRARWEAARGAGATRNGRPIRVSAVDRIEQSQVFHGGLAGVERLCELPGMMALLKASKRQRGFGDFYQHVLVAEGAGEVAIDIGLKPWDIAALVVVVEEAGGRAGALDGSHGMHAGSLVSSNAVLHEQALRILTGEERREPGVASPPLP
ncbi:MAG: histidinol-phosphatase [Burkholderiales bacterium]|nr:histidinol-phosphatase [Burkholderiales bacterium]